MAYVPNSGSVVAFQSDPTKLVGTFSVVGTITATPTGNQSVSGAVTNPPGSVTAVAATQVTSPWIVAPNNSSLYALQVAGSILATSATVLPGSVSGAVTAPPGSILATSAVQPAGSLLTAIQLAGSIMATSATVLPGSVSGAVTAPPGSIMAVSATQPAGSLLTAIQLAGSVMAVSATITPAENQSVSGAVTTPPGSIVSVTNPAGSIGAVLVTQVTSPWIVAPNNSSLYSLQLAGSILATSATLTPGSVSGAVTAPPGSIMATSAVQPAGSLMTVINPAGSIGAVLVTQVTSPWIVAPNNSSMFAVPVGSYVTLQPPGSIMAVSGSFTPAENQSVSGTVNLGVSAAVIGSVATLQGTNPWFTVSPAGSVTAITIPAGSVTAVSAVQPAGSLLTAIQLAGSVLAVSGSFTPAANQSVSGAITAPPGSIATVRVNDLYQEETIGGPSIRGIALVWESNTSTSVMSTVSPTNPLRVLGSVSGAVTFPAGSITAVTNPAGSTTAVLATQVTSPWLTANPGGSVGAVTFPAGSVATVIAMSPAGSITAITIPAGSITAVSGATTTTAGSIISTTHPAGSVTAVSGISFSLSSVVVVAGSIISVPVGSVITVFQNSSLITRVTGSVVTLGVAGSIMATANPAGSIGAVLATQPAGSILYAAVGSVAAFIVGNSSVISIWPAPSIVGTYSEDAAFTAADRGLFTLSMRNDTMSSITSADGDYSGMVVGPVGETIVSNAPINKWFSGQTSVMYGVSVQAIPVGGASIFNYITGVQLTNMSATNALVKFTGGLGSVLAWAIAPATGGSNIIYKNPLRTGENSGFSASINAAASVYVSLQGFTAKT